MLLVVYYLEYSISLIADSGVRFLYFYDVILYSNTLYLTKVLTNLVDPSTGSLCRIFCYSCDKVFSHVPLL